MNRGGARSRLRAVIMLPALAVVATGALVLGALHLRVELEEKIQRLDPTMLLREAGVDLRVVSHGWEESEFHWLPRPTLVLKKVQARFHSGRPGPGLISARLEMDEVRVVSGWLQLLRGRVEGIEMRDGSLECTPDLLPGLARFYRDPLDGSTRPVPWEDLLDAVSDTTARDFRSPYMVAPVLRLSRVEVRPLGWEILKDCAIHLQDAQVDLGEEEWGLWAGLRVECPRRIPRYLPLRLEGRKGAGLLKAEAGRTGSESSLEWARTPQGEWEMRLRASQGGLAAALLEGRPGWVGRAGWTGSWTLDASGQGRLPEGFRSARLLLDRGAVKLLSGTRALEVALQGSILADPGRIQARALLLAPSGAPGDTARLELEVQATSQGARIKGGLAGSVDLAWLRLLGPGWDGKGQAAARLQLPGRLRREGEAWRLLPEGSLRGEFSLLRLPWLQSSMTAGVFRMYAGEEAWDVALSGRMGGSPFELSVQDAAPPDGASGGWSDAASVWSFRSTGGRVEDFAVLPRWAGGTPGLPFWLGLPGKGRAVIRDGSLHGVSVRELQIGTRRTLRSVSVDTVGVLLAGGWIRSEGREVEDTGERILPESRPDLVLEADSLDLERLGPALPALGIDPGGKVEGRLSGRLEIEWSTASEWAESGLHLQGTVRVEDGEARDLPVLEILSSWTGLDGLRVLPIRAAEVRFCLDRDGKLFWDDLELDAGAIRLEGAGRLGEGDTLWAVIRAEAGAGGGWMDLLKSVLKPGTAVHAWIEGPSDLPEVRVITPATYRQARADLGRRFSEASARRPRSEPFR